MTIVNKSIDEIRPYEKNPRKNELSVDKVAESIREFGFKVPIVVDKNGTIVTGHTRYKAAKKLGLREVPCIEADDLTPEQIKAFRLADNKTSEFSEWDDAILGAELLDLEDAGIDMSMFGFEIGYEDGEEEKEEKAGKEYPAMELKAFEHYDYLVFVFDNQFDWMRMCDEFKLRKVNAGYGSTKKIGLGRVIRGSELIKRIGHKNPDTEQEQGEQHNDD